MVSESPTDPHPTDTGDADGDGGSTGSAPAGQESGYRESEDQGAVRSRDTVTKLPERLTFRITPVSLIGVLTVAVCVSPAAAAIPWLLWLYVIPLALLVWVLRVRTTVDRDGITARTVTRRIRFDWDDVRALRLNERKWVHAVLLSGRDIKLPAVRVRDLPRVAAMSGGRISDPAAEPAQE